MSEVKVSISFRGAGPTGGLKRYAEEKLQRLHEYFSEPLPHTGRRRTEDLYAAIDLALDKIERQIRKHKEKFKIEPRRDGPG